MAWFKRKPDPLADRARTLSQEIARLEAEIKRLDSHLEHKPPGEPIFEELNLGRLDSPHETPTTANHYNELGVRKYDLPALWKRLRNHFRGPSTTNPKLVNYLAAGGIQGLRPLRYEKRVARNRFIFLVVVLFLFLLGLVLAFSRRHL